MRAHWLYGDYTAGERTGICPFPPPTGLPAPLYPSAAAAGELPSGEVPSFLESQIRIRALSPVLIPGGLPAFPQTSKWLPHFQGLQVKNGGLIPDSFSHCSTAIVTRHCLLATKLLLNPSPFHPLATVLTHVPLTSGLVQLPPTGFSCLQLLFFNSFPFQEPY